MTIAIAKLIREFTYNGDAFGPGPHLLARRRPRSLLRAVSGVDDCSHRRSGFNGDVRLQVRSRGRCQGFACVSVTFSKPCPTRIGLNQRTARKGGFFS